MGSIPIHPRHVVASLPAMTAKMTAKFADGFVNRLGPRASLPMRAHPADLERRLTGNHASFGCNVYPKIQSDLSRRPSSNSSGVSAGDRLAVGLTTSPLSSYWRRPRARS